jgi:fatty-acid desaturase
MSLNSLFYSRVSAIFYTQVLFTAIMVATIFLNVSLWWWGLSVFVYFLTGCLGITITYHRYLSHRSFKMPKSLEYVFSILGALGGTGSTIGWVLVHRAHHRYSDKPGDPHSPHIGGWKNLFSIYDYKINLFHAKKLLKSKFHIFLHKYYYLILALWAAFLLVIGWKVLLFGFIIPVAIQIWASSISNFGNHLWGYRNFNTNENSRNTWWIAAITWGEGWHNNHHARPWSYTFKHKWWEFDISAVVIKIITFSFGYSNSTLKR